MQNNDLKIIHLFVRTYYINTFMTNRSGYNIIALTRALTFIKIMMWTEKSLIMKTNHHDFINCHICRYYKTIYITITIKITVNKSLLQVCEMKFSCSYLQWRPPFAAVTALQALVAFRVISLMRIHMELEILLWQKARATDPAVVRSEQRLEGSVVLTSKINEKLVV